MSCSLYVSGKTCHSSSVLFTPDCGPESSSPLTQIQHGFDCCDAQLASEMGQEKTLPTPRQPVDLAATTKDIKPRIKRVLVNFEPITQRAPILADPRAVWLDITLSIVALESVTVLMKRAWWP